VQAADIKRSESEKATKAANNGDVRARAPSHPTAIQKATQDLGITKDAVDAHVRARAPSRPTRALALERLGVSIIERQRARDHGGGQVLRVF
jgi:hypothetical protein